MQGVRSTISTAHRVAQLCRGRDDNSWHLLNLYPMPDIAPKMYTHYLISSSHQACELDLIIMTTFQHRKLILRDVKYFAQVYSVRRWQKRGSNPGLFYFFEL